jgi:hypothetical protein
MSHLSNPLATAEQLYKNVSNNALPIELQDSIRFYTARLTQAAGLLLRLPQSITAQANVHLFRYWLVDDLMRFEFSVRFLSSEQDYDAKKSLGCLCSNYLPNCQNICFAQITTKHNECLRIPSLPRLISQRCYFKPKSTRSRVILPLRINLY